MHVRKAAAGWQRLVAGQVFLTSAIQLLFRDNP